MTKTVPLIEPSPSRADAAAARRSLDALREHAKVTVGDAMPPASAVAALEHVLEALADVSGVAVLPLDAELTIQEAADLIGVSRPTLVKLLDADKLTFRTLRVADILAYRKARDDERKQTLDVMVAENQRLGLYDD